MFQPNTHGAGCWEQGKTTHCCCRPPAAAAARGCCQRLKSRGQPLGRPCARPCPAGLGLLGDQRRCSSGTGCHCWHGQQTARAGSRPLQTGCRESSCRSRALRRVRAREQRKWPPRRLRPPLSPGRAPAARQRCAAGRVAMQGPAAGPAGGALREGRRLQPRPPPRPRQRQLLCAGRRARAAAPGARSGAPWPAGTRAAAAVDHCLPTGTACTKPICDCRFVPGMFPGMMPRRRTEGRAGHGHRGTHATTALQAKPCR